MVRLIFLALIFAVAHAGSAFAVGGAAAQKMQAAGSVVVKEIVDGIRLVHGGGGQPLRHLRRRRRVVASGHRRAEVRAAAVLSFEAQLGVYFV